MCNIFSPFIIQFYYYVQGGPKIVIQTYLDWTNTLFHPVILHSVYKATRILYRLFYMSVFA